MVDRSMSHAYVREMQYCEDCESEFMANCEDIVYEPTPKPGQYIYHFVCPECMEKRFDRGQA
jgi:hypothetical protein